MSDSSQIRDTIELAREMARELARDKFGLVGYGTIELWHPDGSLGLARPFANLVTDTGDLYYAQMAIALVTPAAPAQPTKMTGMQIGSGTTAVAKSGAGAAMVTFLSNAGVAFDATYPQTNNLGAGLGVEAVYKTTFNAGVGTGTVQEATVTNTATLTTASVAGNTIARILTGAVTKAAGDALAITWRHKYLGA